MITVANRIPVNSEYHEAFEARFQERAGLVEKMPGFIAFQMLRPTAPDTPYIVLTFWESQEAYRAWVDSDEFKQSHNSSGSLPREAYRGRPDLEVHEVIQMLGDVPNA
jgi:heme oxygenase (mycobilin-producing)